jgi:S-disulfanyl-L-cysteine oxidoreductase SoxD
MSARLKSSFVVLCLAGCGGTTPPAETAEPVGGAAPPAPPAQSMAAPSTFAEQVAMGQKLYGEHCAECHGASGEGGKDVPRVVGLANGALPLDPPPTAKFRKNRFETVADVAQFATKNMPPTAPGSLTEEQYWSILAFDLKANGIELDKKLDAAVASGLTIPRK